MADPGKMSDLEYTYPDLLAGCHFPQKPTNPALENLSSLGTSS